MPPTPPIDDRVDEAVAEYLRAAQAGAPPDRAAFLARHPDLAAELAAFLDDRNLVEGLLGPLAAPAPHSTPSPEWPPSLTVTAGGVVTDGDPAAAVVVSGRYELLGEVARGGMGVVYRARDRRLGRVVALKMVLAGRHASAADRARFLREAEAAAALDHPHIVPVYEVGEDGGTPFFGMRLIDGESLSARAPHLAGDWRAVARLMATVARAVDHAHRRGVLHRDLKPSNILIDAAGEPHVTDFGLAVRAGADTLSGSGAAGTPAYMAPEQAAGERARQTTATDVWGLGAVLYHLLAGRPPFPAPSVPEALLRVLRDDPERPSRVRSGVPRDLETISLKCLEKDPARRYGSAAAVAADLDRWLRGEPVEARPTTGLERAAKWVRRNPAAALLAGVSGLAAAAVVWASVALAYNAELAGAKRQVEEANETLAGVNRQLDAALVQVRGEKAEADRLRGVAEGREEQVRRLNYVARFRAADMAWGDGRLALASGLLHDPPPGSPAPRTLAGVEWTVLGAGPVEVRPVGPPQGSAPGTGGPTVTVTHLDIGPDGRRVAFAARPVKAGTAELAVWDIDRGAQVCRCQYPGDPGRIDAVALAGGYVFAGRAEAGELHVFDQDSGRLVRSIASSAAGGLRAARWAVGPGGEWMAVGYEDGTVQVTDAAIGCRPAKFGAAGDPAAPLAVHPAGAVVVWGGDQPGFWDRATAAPYSLPDTFWDRATPASYPPVTVVGPNERPWAAVAFAADGASLAVVAAGRVELWDPAGRRRVRVLGRHDGATRVAFSDDGRRVVTWRPGQQVRLWDAHGGLLAPFTPDAPPLYAARAVGTTLVTASADPLRLVGVTRAVVAAGGTRFLPTDRLPISVALTPDGGQVLAADGSAVRMWSLPDGRPVVGPPPKAGRYNRVAVSPDGRFAGVAHDGLSVFELPGGTVKAVIEEPGRDSFGDGYDVTFQPGGPLAAATRGLGQLTIWNWRTKQALHRLKTGGVWSVPAAFSPDGRYLAVGVGTYGKSDEVLRGPVLVYDAATGTLVKRLDGFLDGVWSVAWSPDGRWLATGSGIYKSGGVGEVKVWDTATWDLVYDLKGHAECVWSVAFSPDGRRLASAAGRFPSPLAGNRPDADPGPGELLVWDLTTGQPLLSRRTPEQRVMAVAFSRDGRWFAAAEQYGVRVWDLRPPQVAAAPPLPDAPTAVAARPRP